MKFSTFLMIVIVVVFLTSCTGGRPAQVEQNSPVRYVKSAHDTEVEARQQALNHVRLVTTFDFPNVEISVIGTNSEILSVSGQSVTNDLAHDFQRKQSIELAHLKQLGFVTLKFTGPTQSWEFKL